MPCRKGSGEQPEPEECLHFLLCGGGVPLKLCFSDVGVTASAPRRVALTVCKQYVHLAATRSHPPSVSFQRTPSSVQRLSLMLAGSIGEQRPRASNSSHTSPLPPSHRWFFHVARYQRTGRAARSWLAAFDWTLSSVGLCCCCLQGEESSSQPECPASATRHVTGGRTEKF